MDLKLVAHSAMIAQSMWHVAYLLRNAMYHVRISVYISSNAMTTVSSLGDLEPVQIWLIIRFPTTSM